MEGTVGGREGEVKGEGGGSGFDAARGQRINLTHRWRGWKAVDTRWVRERED